MMGQARLDGSWRLILAGSKARCVSAQLISWMRGPAPKGESGGPPAALPVACSLLGFTEKRSRKDTLHRMGKWILRVGDLPRGVGKRDTLAAIRWPGVSGVREPRTPGWVSEIPRDLQKDASRLRQAAEIRAPCAQIDQHEASDRPPVRQVVVGSPLNPCRAVR